MRRTSYATEGKGFNTIQGVPHRPPEKAVEREKKEKIDSIFSKWFEGGTLRQSFPNLDKLSLLDFPFDSLDSIMKTDEVAGHFTSFCKVLSFFLSFDLPSP